MTDDLKLGATGEFPQGKMNPTDEGACNIAIARDPQGRVVVNFGKPVVWFALYRTDAIQFAKLILQKANVKRFTFP